MIIKMNIKNYKRRVTIKIEKQQDDKQRGENEWPR